MKTIRTYLTVLMFLCCCCGTAAATPLIIINEVLYDGPGADADDVFTELFGVPGLTLDGWSITGTNGATGSVYRTIDLTGAVIQADGILVIATDLALGSVFDARDFIANVDWQNGPDSIQLLDNFAMVVDSLQYGDAGSFNRGEGLYSMDVAAGHSLSRNIFGLDTDDNRSDFIDLSSATPGIGPAIASVPEPGSLILMTLGMFGLFANGRLQHNRQACRQRSNRY